MRFQIMLTLLYQITTIFKIIKMKKIKEQSFANSASGRNWHGALWQWAEIKLSGLLYLFDSRQPPKDIYKSGSTLSWSSGTVTT